MRDELTRILLVDDHPFFREGVKLYLSGVEGFELVGAVSRGEEALKFVANNSVDVVLMDLQMPGMDGIATTAELMKRDQSLRILILTSFGAGEKVQQALATGAAGYCLKDAPPAELAAAVRAVAAGGTYLGQGINITMLTEQGAPRPKEDTRLEGLTLREQEVFELLAKGMGNKEIAEALYVSEKTVKTHVANILQKLNVKTRTQAALLANKTKPLEDLSNA